MIAMRSAIRRLVEMLLRVNDTPERTALAYAIGVFLAFSPFFGLHTILGIVVAFLFGLNRVAVIVGVYTNTPWTVVPFYAFATYFGRFFYQVPSDLPFHIKDMGSIEFWKKLISEWSSLWPVLIPTFIGSLILSVVLALISYPIALRFIRAYQSKRTASERG